ncbi:ParB/RepB/Spo0J family partition protein [Sphingomonas sp.]|uniref:ParB/RepB/Spo0J family partition protein n=1 Tax=Sphingomonas sp. TaxID=28214 RepID=UPI003F72DB6F
MSVRTFTAAQLDVSPFNVRKDRRAIESLSGLEASILRVGLILPLAVHPLKGSKKFGVFDGGRRFRAIRNLITRGDLPADWPIDASVRDIASEAELLEISSAAGLLHIDLLPWEVMEGLRRATRRGASVEEIAEVTGQSVTWVRQHLRLADLAEPVFAAYVAGDITQEQARAFAATADHQLQRAAWDAFGHLPSWDRTVAKIHRLMKVGDREDERLLRFVGEQAFRDAGGVFELDLFADAAEHRGHVVQPGLLRELAEANLEGVRDSLRRSTGRPDLRFAVEYPQARHGGVDRDLELVPELTLPPADTERLAFLRDELLELEFQFERVADPQAASAADAVADCRAEIATIEARQKIILPDGEIYATLLIEQSGELETRWWWANHKAKKLAETPAAPERLVSAGPIGDPAPTTVALAVDAGQGSANQQQADAAAKGEHGLTQEGVQIARSIRREMLRAVLVGDYGTGMGHDYLIWGLLRRELSERHDHRAIGARGLTRADDAPPMAMADAVLSLVRATPAHAAWTATLAQLRAHPAVAEPDAVAAFAAFRDESAEWKELAAAAVAGMALTRTANLDGYRLPIHDHLIWESGFADDEALRELWEPTEAFIALLPRARRIELADPHLDEATRRNLATMKAAETVAPVTRALARVCWVHPALQFQPTDTAPIAAELVEEAA